MMAFERFKQEQEQLSKALKADDFATAFEIATRHPSNSPHKHSAHKHIHPKFR